MKFTDFTKNLENKIKQAYEEGVTTEESEKLAAEFLHAMMTVSSQLKTSDLDARMRKSGVKAIRAVVYLENVAKADKKPSDVMLDAIINNNGLVNKEQESFDKAEVEKDELERYYNIFKEAHIYFRGIAKGKFD